MLIQSRWMMTMMIILMKSTILSRWQWLELRILCFWTFFYRLLLCWLIDGSLRKLINFLLPGLSILVRWSDGPSSSQSLTFFYAITSRGWGENLFWVMSSVHRHWNFSRTGIPFTEPQKLFSFFHLICFVWRSELERS